MAQVTKCDRCGKIVREAYKLDFAAVHATGESITRALDDCCAECIEIICRCIDRIRSEKQKESKKSKEPKKAKEVK